MQVARSATNQARRAKRDAHAVAESSRGAAGGPAPDRNRILEHGRAAAAPEARAMRPMVVTLKQGGADKALAMRDVAASAAHDLGNLLAAIGINLDSLASEELSPGGADAIRSLRAETSYLRGLAQELRAAAAESEAPDAAHCTHLAAWWPGMRTLLRAVHHDEIVIRAQVPWGLPAVCISPEHLTQVVLNLVGNAAHAIVERPDRREDGAGSPADGLTRGEVEVSARLADGGLAVDLSVADNGAGMSVEIVARACEPHFTTRAGRGGTGLGLAMVQRLVGHAGGRVRLNSVVGFGTAVTMELPIRAETEPPAMGAAVKIGESQESAA